MSPRAYALAAALALAGCAAAVRRADVRPAHTPARPRPRATPRGDGLDAALDRGVDLREAGRDEDALAVFRDAWARWRSPRARAQMGMAEHALGRWVAAEEHLRESLASTDPWVQRNREPLTGALAQVAAHVATLDVSGTPAGAEVEVNGVRVGALPLGASIRVAEGTVRLSLRAPGHRPDARQIELRGGAVARERIALSPLRR